MKWLDIEIDRLWLRKDESINGAALSRPPLLLFNYVEIEHLKRLGRLPSNFLDTGKFDFEGCDLDGYIRMHLELDNGIAQRHTDRRRSCCCLESTFP